MNLTTKLKRLPWCELAIVIALLGINGYAAFSDAYNLPNKWFTRDDAYYYFKVAQNSSEGPDPNLLGWPTLTRHRFALVRRNTSLAVAQPGQHVRCSLLRQA